jgi:hypothetical protein
MFLKHRKAVFVPYAHQRWAADIKTSNSFWRCLLMPISASPLTFSDARNIFWERSAMLGVVLMFSS